MTTMLFLLHDIQESALMNLLQEFNQFVLEYAKQNEVKQNF